MRFPVSTWLHLGLGCTGRLPAGLKRVHTGIPFIPRWIPHFKTIRSSLVLHLIVSEVPKLLTTDLQSHVQLKAARMKPGEDNQGGTVR